MKIQYYASDLSYLLNIGEIVDMHVVTLESGRQVLRIDCAEKKDDEYQTVRAKSGQPRAKPRPASKDNYKPKNKTLRGPNVPDNPDTGFGSKAAEFGGKLGKGLVEWIKTPPRKRPEDW